MSPNTLRGALRAVGSLALLLLAGCGGGTNTFSPNVTGAGGTFALTLTPTTQTVVPAATRQAGGIPYQATITSQGGFSGPVALSLARQPQGVANGLPESVQASFDPGTVQVTPSAPGQATLRLTVPANTPDATYAFDVVATSGALSSRARATLVVNLGNVAPVGAFAVALQPSTQTVVPFAVRRQVGGGVAYQVQVTSQSGFSGPVALTTDRTPQGVANGLPAAIDVSFDRAGVNVTPTQGGFAQMNVVVPAGVPDGTYQFDVIGTSGALTSRARATLIVSLTPNGTFTVTVAPTTQTVNIPVAPGRQALTATYQVTVASQSGFSDQVEMDVSNLPGTVVGAFNPGIVTATPATPGTTQLTLTIDPATPAGNYPFTVIGRSGILTAQTTATLVVTRNVLVDRR